MYGIGSVKEDKRKQHKNHEKHADR